ncbi:MAG: ABC transporter permease subunit [Anaerolineae bacterium]
MTIVQGAFARGLEPILGLLQQPDVQHALLITFTLSFGAVLINTIAGLVVAWVLVRHKFPTRKFFRLAGRYTFCILSVIAGYAMIVLFGRNGWLVTTFIQIVFALPGILLAKTFVSLPFVIRELQPVLDAMSPEQEEAAYTVGASRWKTFVSIILPEIWTALLYGVVLTFSRAVGEFGAVAVVSGAIEGLTETATSFVFRALNDRNNIGAYSMSVLLGLVSVIVLILMSILKRRVVAPRR